MKINRIDIKIPRANNTHIPYLNNQIMEFVSRVKVGGTYANDFIELRQVPSNNLRQLKKQGINYEKIKK